MLCLFPLPRVLQYMPLLHVSMYNTGKMYDAPTCKQNSCNFYFPTKKYTEKCVQHEGSDAKNMPRHKVNLHHSNIFIVTYAYIRFQFLNFSSGFLLKYTSYNLYIYCVVQLILLIFLGGGGNYQC